MDMSSDSSVLTSLPALMKPIPLARDISTANGARAINSIGAPMISIVLTMDNVSLGGLRES